jgi:P27 family predicted phage terminase small subunit
MGARGPLPIPTAIKEARGTLRPSRCAANEPHAAGLPKVPKDLNPDAKKEFKRLLKLLSAMGVVGAVDGNALERYVRTWLQWRIATQMVERTGPVIASKDSDGKPKFKRSPYIDVAATYASQLDKLEQAFGLHPSARSRIEVQAPITQPENISRFFDRPGNFN